MCRRSEYGLLCAVGLLIVLTASMAFASEGSKSIDGNYCPVIREANADMSTLADHRQGHVEPTLKNRSEYSGRLIIYVTEIVSQWKDYSGTPYHFGFLDFATNGTVWIEDSYTNIFQWDGTSAGFGDVEEQNLMVFAVLFNSEGNQGYADPPSALPFTAHYVDAMAMTVPGGTGSDTSNQDFTHRVFAEYATATWCSACPNASAYLYNLYNTGGYPFGYVSMVCDVNQKAYDRMNLDYNFGYYPTSFFDGGYRVYVGSNASYFNAYIQQSGARAVPDVDLDIGVEWTGVAKLDITVEITNHEFVNYPPGTPVTPTGDDVGIEGSDLGLITSAVDPNSQQVYFMWDWGNGEFSEARTV